MHVCYLHLSDNGNSYKAYLHAWTYFYNLVSHNGNSEWCSLELNKISVFLFIVHCICAAGVITCCIAFGILFCLALIWIQFFAATVTHFHCKNLIWWAGRQSLYQLLLTLLISAWLCFELLWGILKAGITTVYIKLPL